MKTKIIRTSTVPISLNILLKGQLKFLNQTFHIIGVSSAGKDLIEIQNREGIPTHSVEMKRGISPIKDFVSLIKLFIVFKNEKPAVVHSITPKAGLLTMLAGKLAGVPIRMHTFTGLIFPTRTGAMQKLLIKMDQLLCLSATHIYPEGNGVKNDLISYKITSKPLKVIANGNVNGIDLDFFSKEHFSTEQLLDLKEELGIQPNDFVFVFVGRLVGDKGINELVAAFKELETRNQKLEIRNQKLETRDREVGVSLISSPQSLVSSKVPKLLLVGTLESDLDPLKEETLKEITTNPNIISVGFQKDVRPYFAISNALVFPSYREGFPNVVMQAGAMELPSIVSNINGCNEIIVEGENGTIIPVKNAEAITVAMQKMMYDTNYYSELQQNARPMIQARYEQSVVWNALLDEYNMLIKKLDIKN
ncbi:glycosyltransferase family 4 protein [Empedobacter sp. GD03644]|uniref:glycosyltransferase family 4 protein n=1 Tax=Empedobacter sp. GD03644 TaxID=2975358 RepID=UPI0024495054|nr:glycosyltransferase family 4 protein [Empedobacter sp. GD03644]MDH2207304.1 glycosyltransferase family 4 protein [Empedobacter sp. GD03644]